MNDKGILAIRTSPHIRSPIGTNDIMRNVALVLLPISAMAVYVFGSGVLLILAVAVLSSVGTETILCRLSGRNSTVGDWSAIITGLLLGLTLPPAFPLWMTALGGIISIGLGKFLFGGLGFNVFNPALVGRAFLQAAFPVAITTWEPALAPERFTSLDPAILTLPFLHPLPAIDAISQATPLAKMKFDHQMTPVLDLFVGRVNGSAGETSTAIILLGGGYLALRRMLNWRIPAAILLTVGVLSAIFQAINPRLYAGPEFMLFSGGVMLGAVFMATDMVCSPVTPLGVWIYGIIIGALTVIIRYFGGLPEGVMYSILFGNALTPMIDRLTRPRVFGAAKGMSRST